jgi:MoxR-like ATPase
MDLNNVFIEARGRKEVPFNEPSDLVFEDGSTGQEFIDEVYKKYGQNDFKLGDFFKRVWRKNLVQNDRNKIKKFAKYGFIEDQPKKGYYALTQKSLNFISNASSSPAPSVDPSQSANAEPDEDMDAGSDKNVKGKLAKSKLDLKNRVKKKMGVISKSSKFYDLVFEILTHMEEHIDTHAKMNFLLTGDPGTGKTSFVKTLSDIIGIPRVIIEAPHITEEHIVNIPFLVISGNKLKKGNMAVDDRSMEVVRAESNLVTEIRKSQNRKKPIEQVESQMKRNKIAWAMYNKDGGKIKKFVQDIRPHYNTILFLDEYYRNANETIKNVLRNILNGKIGNSPIPKGTYIIYASNMNDEGLAPVFGQEQFRKLNFDQPEKSDWFNYMYSKFGNYEDAEGDSDFNGTENVEAGEDIVDEETGEVIKKVSDDKIEIKPEVFLKFEDILTQEDFGSMSNNVRLSPRRLEQMLLYISESLPVDSVREAQALLSFVKTNLKDYEEGGLHEKYLEMDNAVRQLIVETSDKFNDVSELENVGPLRPEDWKYEMAHQLAMKMKLKDKRQYVPIISGPPGISKTRTATITAKQLGLEIIEMDVANASAEDVVGLPIPEEQRDEVNVKFSNPPMFEAIMKEYNEKVVKPGKKPNAEGFTTLLFFDELSRAKVPVFNAIREVLLEKQFGEKHPLPDDMVVMGAMNPTGEGVEELTLHVRDVLDIVEAQPSYSEFIDYIKTKKSYLEADKKLGFEISQSMVAILNNLVTDFKVTEDEEGNKIGIEQQPFNWGAGQGINFYVSPREMDGGMKGAIASIQSNFVRRYDWDLSKSYTEDEFETYIDLALKITSRVFAEQMLGFVTEHKNEFGSEVSKMISSRIMTDSKYRDAFQNIKEKKDPYTTTLSSLMKDFDGDFKEAFDAEYLSNYVLKFDPSKMAAEFTEIINNYVFATKMTPIDKYTKIYNMFDVLQKSLTKLNVTNEYRDMIANVANNFLGQVFDKDALTKEDIIDILNNDTLLNMVDDVQEKMKNVMGV